jgi:glycosyltransferase involved in cell wall biosynthesis
MLRSVGYSVIHYGNEGATSGANEQVDIKSGLERYDPTGPTFIGDTANVSNPVYVEFNKNLAIELRKRVKPKDIICLPFGHAHQEAIQGIDAYWLETGIGYPVAFAPYKIFESNAWYNWHCGKEQRTGNDYNFVIPNYYDISEWTLQPNKGKYLLYFGRICDIKGLQIVLEIAKHRPDLDVILCGQGDATPYLIFPNIKYQPPVHGKDRDKLLGNALAVLMPTRYIEPFGGVTIEANLCGTPVLGSSYGSFTETIQQGINGFRCATLGDFLAGIEKIEGWGPSQREWISSVTRDKYDMYNLAHSYDNAIKQLCDLDGKGWYELRSPIGPIEKAQVAA